MNLSNNKKEFRRKAILNDALLPLLVKTSIPKDNADTIVGNCDSTLFLGGKGKTTLKELSETLGKETIDLYNTSETRSNAKIAMD